MRCLSLIAASALLLLAAATTVGATAAAAGIPTLKQLQETESLQSMVIGTVDAHVKPVAAHRFGALQREGTSTSSSSSSSPFKQECLNNTEFLLEFIYFNGNCSDFGRTMDSITNVDGYNTTSVGVANEACNSRCFARVKNIITNWGSKCLNKETLGGLRLVQTFCDTDPSTGAACAVTMSRTNGRCEKFSNDETGCRARSAACMYNATTKRCESYVSPSVLNAYCGSSCVSNVLKVYGETFDASAALTAKIGLDLICLKVDDLYCALVINDVRDQLDLSLQNPSRPRYCSNRTAATCVVVYVKTSYEVTAIYAQASLKSCVQSSRTEAGRNSCLRDFASQLSFMDKIFAIIDITCQTTDGTANGKPCIGQYINVTSKSELQACGRTLDTANTCSTDCDSRFNAALIDLGCCAHPIGTLMANPRIDDRRLPKIENQTLTLANANTSKISGPWESLAPCPSVQANKSLTAKCAVPESARIKRELRTSLAFAALKRDVALLARMKLAMKKDIAKSIGVTEDTIVDDDFVEDTSRQVTVSSTGSRKQATRANAANYKFSLAGVDSTSTADAAKTFDSKSSAGTLSTTSTASEVASCTGCADTSATATGGIVAPSSPTTSSAGVLTSAAAIATAIVVVLAFTN